MIVEPSISGVGAGISEVASYSEMDVTGKLNINGLLTISGSKIYNPELWKAHQANVILKVALGSYIADHYTKLHWTDVLAVTLTVNNPTINQYTGKPVYLAGNRQLDSTAINVIATEIVKSDGTKDWNTVMNHLNLVDPVIDDVNIPDSPFNPKSPYYDPDRAVFAYDPQNHYIIYKDGEVVWIKSGKRYWDKENGEAISYDPLHQILKFESGNTLNLVTLELTTPDNVVTVVKNSLPWYKAWFRKFLSDTKMQLTVAGILIVLLFLKAKKQSYAR